MAKKESIMVLKRGVTMEKGTALVKSKELTVAVENINFRLLIDKPRQSADGEDEFVLHSHISAEIFVCG